MRGLAGLPLLTPLPGSEDHQKLAAKGAWMDPDLNKYDLNHVTAPHNKMSRDDWERAYLAAWQTYYTNEHMETVLRRMNEAGVLGRFIPAFGRVVAMMQFNMYHHYTVDEHLLRCIGILQDIERGGNDGGIEPADHFVDGSQWVVEMKVMGAKWNSRSTRFECSPELASPRTTSPGRMLLPVTMCSRSTTRASKSQSP